MLQWLSRESPLVLFAFLALAWVAAGLWIIGSNLADLKPFVLVLSGFITVLLPVVVGMACEFRYQLWHCFAWIALIAAQLAYFVQG
jgi:hypothetical protein